MQTDPEELVCKIDNAQMSEAEAGETEEGQAEGESEQETAAEAETGNE
jgi:hypothetical protein